MTGLSDKVWPFVSASTEPRPITIREDDFQRLTAERDDLRRMLVRIKDSHPSSCGVSALTAERDAAQTTLTQLREAVSALADAWDHSLYDCPCHRGCSAAIRALLLPAPVAVPKCICPRFSDTGGFRIADLTCPIHGVGGTDPGDGPWDEPAPGSSSLIGPAPTENEAGR